MEIAENEWMGKVPDQVWGEPQIDEAMLAFGDFIAEMADVDGYLVDEEQAASMQVEEVELSFPIQLDLHVRDNGQVGLGSSPPLYYAETTIMPVFHQLKVHITVTENSDQNGNSGE